MKYISCTVVCLRRTSRPGIFGEPRSSLLQLGPPTFSFRSLQFRQPNLDLRRALPLRTSLGQDEAMPELLNPLYGCERFFPSQTIQCWRIIRKMWRGHGLATLSTYGVLRSSTRSSHRHRHTSRNPHSDAPPAALTVFRV